MIQHLTPEERRGRVLGLWSCASFVGIIMGNFLFLAVKQTGVPSNRVFLLCGGLGMICVVIYYLHWRSIFADALRSSKELLHP
jgi:MFS family permease